MAIWTVWAVIAASSPAFFASARLFSPSAFLSVSTCSGDWIETSTPAAFRAGWTSGFPASPATLGIVTSAAGSSPGE